MIIDRPAVDWLTMTTYSMPAWNRAGGLLETLGPGAGKLEASVGAYRGFRGDGWFVGDAMQRGQIHYMMRVSGDLSDQFFFNVMRPPMDCTRIDLQLTIDAPVPIGMMYKEYKHLTDLLAEHEKKRGQRARKLDTILSPDGLCTAYIGSRSSQRFVRIYVKLHDGDYFLRFEVEYKDKNGLAGSVWREIGRSPIKIVSIMRGELASLPVHPLISPFYEMLRGAPDEIMSAGRIRTSPNRTLVWLQRQCLPSFKRMLGYHDTRDRAMMLLSRLNDYAAGLEGD